MTPLDKNFLFIYGACHFGKSLLWVASSLVFAFFLTELVGISPLIMGALLGSSLVLNAVGDLVVGYWLGRFVRNALSASQIQMIGAVLAGAALVAFSLSPLVLGAAKLSYALVTLFAFRIGYSLFDVPQNAIMAFMGLNDEIRMLIGATRYLTSGLALVVVTGLLSRWLHDFDFIKSVYPLIVSTAALAITSITGAIGLRYYMFKRFNYVELQFPLKWNDLLESIRASNISFVHISDFFRRKLNLTGANHPTHMHQFSLNRFFKLPAWTPSHHHILVIISILVFSFTMPLFTKLEAYYVVYVIDGISASVFMLAVAAGQICAQGLLLLIVKKTKVKYIYLVSSVLLCIAAILFYIFGFYFSIITISLAFAYGAASSSLLMAIWSMHAEVAGKNPNFTTLAYGLFTCCSKLAQAASVWSIGLFLQSFAYRDFKNSNQIVNLMSAGPFITGAACIILSFFFIFKTGIEKNNLSKGN